MTATAMTERDPDLLREASEWFARFDGDDITAEDRRRFHAWQQRSPQHERAFQDVVDLWSAPEFSSALSSAEPVDSWIPTPAQPLPRRRAWISGAVAAMLSAVPLLWFLGGDLLTVLQSDYRTTIGEQRTVYLADRSTITLNTNTAIAVNLAGQARRIHLLKGEALFSISPDPERPFTVEHKGNAVRVLGTEFLVREQQQAITVTVVRGTVEVSRAGAAAATLLTAGQQASAGPDGLGTPRHVDPADLTAWTARRLAVTNAPLSDVIEEIQRYHSGFVWIWNPAIGRIRVTGIYDLSNTMDTLNVLADTLPVRMDRLTDRLVVLR